MSSTSGLDLTHDDLVCDFTLTGDATTAGAAWYVDASPLMRLYLPFEGGAANAASDHSGNGIAVTPNGDPTWNPAAGHDGHGAYEFDGNDDLTAGDNFPVGSSYTKTAWVYRTGSGNNGGNNIISGDANTGGHAFWAPDMYGNQLSAGHNGTWNAVQDNVALGLNTWYFVAVTFDDATDVMRLYKNGVMVDTAVVTVAVTDATISIGSFGYGNGYMWKGTLDDIRVYDRALSPPQIQAMYYDGSNVIKFSETAVGDVWRARVTPFSASEVGSAFDTDTLLVVDGSMIAPSIASTPDVSAVVGELYTYDVDATGSPSPAYSLTTAPAGMTVNAYTGLIEWTPAVVGGESVTVNASNAAGTDGQTFVIGVTAGPVPEIENLGLTSSSGNDLTTDDLTCAYDLAGTASTAATAWYVSGSPVAPVMRLLLPFEGGLANSLNDYSGNGIAVTAHGDPTWSATAGHDGGGAYVFDGNDDLTAGENFPVGSSYTKTAWVYRTGSGSNGGNNIMAGDANNGGHAFWAPDSYGNRLSAGHNGTWNAVQDAVPLALNTWYFGAVSYDDPTDVMRLYKNGALIDSAVVTAAVTDATIS
ncbi:MAG: putative Ig domain-containing protein, partial [bacterium]